MEDGQVQVSKEEEDEEDQQNEKQYCFYSTEMMEGLMKRYEPPDDRNRWDKPLYRVDVSTFIPNPSSSNSNDSNANAVAVSTSTSTSTSTSVAKNVLEKSVYNMHSLSDAIENDHTTTTTNQRPSQDRPPSKRKQKQQQQPNNLL